MPPGSRVPAEEEIRAALRSVDDPEVGVNIVDLGLVYRIEVSPERVRIELTMTSPACPLGDLVIDGSRQAVGAILPKGMDVEIELVWDPPWTPDRMSEDAKQTFGWSR